MAELHRIDRRLFLSDLGKRTMAFAVLGSGVLAACSSDGAVAVAEPHDATGAGSEATTSTTRAAADDSQTTTSSAEDTTTQTDADQLQALVWERVLLGSVSAYVLARGAEIAIVDTGRGGSAPMIETALTTLGASWDNVNNVILTHLHGDHVGSLPEVLDLATSAVAYAGRADVDGISAPREIEALDDGDEVFGMQVIATPGHTPGHIAVFDPTAGFLVAGDALNESGGMVLGPNPSFSSDIAQANASVQRLADRGYETVVFGHGNPIESGASDSVLALAQTLS
jgi:glyoxylase-like metal-dependent hydrolase (beta-lactamase superfamily II)